MAAQRPDDPIEWVENRLRSAHDEIAAISLSHHQPNATIKADIQAIELQLEALTDIVHMVAVELDALRHQDTT